MNAGYIYVLAFGNGTVKVGRTKNHGQRMSAHKSTARSFGMTVIGEWVSPLHTEWLANEDALKKIASDLGGTAMSPEYFSGVDFAAVVEKARELPFTSPESAAEARGDMDGRRHYREAGRLLAASRNIPRREDGTCPEADRMIAEAQVHAALALADNALNDSSRQPPVPSPVSRVWTRENVIALLKDRGVKDAEHVVINCIEPEVAIRRMS